MVAQLATGLSTNHKVAYPDQKNNRLRLPDLLVDNNYAMDVKVINPDEEDYQIDKTAIDNFKKGELAEAGGTIKTDNIKSAFKEACEQLENTGAGIRIIVLISTLEIQNSDPSYIKYILKGIESYILRDVRGKITSIGKKMVSVPVTKKLSSRIDAILYIYGKGHDKRVLWKLNNKDCKLYREMSAKQDSLWI